MAACEKCWNDAYLRSELSNKDHHECYKELLEQRKDNPCTPREQAGQFWDDEKQKDKRLA